MATIANNDLLFMRLHCEDAPVVVEGQETNHEVGVMFEGRLLTP